MKKDIKEKPEEYESKRILRIVADSAFIDLLPFDDRGKIIATLAWRDGKSMGYIAKALSLSEERIKILLERAIQTMARFIREVPEIEKIKKENEELLNLVNAYQSRFNALDGKEEEIKTENSSSEKPKPTKKKFGDIKILRMRLQEMNLPNHIKWKLLSDKIINLANLSSFTPYALVAHGFNKKDIEFLGKLLKKHKLKFAGIL